MLFILKTDSKIIHWLGSLCLSAILALAIGTTVNARSLGKGVITALKLNIRSAPEQDADVVVVLGKGEEVDILAANGGLGGWLKVRYKGETGFVRNRAQYIATRPSDKYATGIKLIKRASLMPKPTNKPADDVKLTISQSKKNIREKIEQETQKLEAFSEKEAKILEGLDAIDYALSKARVRATNLHRETRALSHEIDAIQVQISKLSNAMELNQTYAGTRLDALYRLHMMGSLEMAGPPASLFEFFVAQNALKKVVASDFSLLAKQKQDMEKLAHLQNDLSQQIASRTQLEAELALQIRIREKESHKKSVLLQQIRQEKKLSQAAIASLASSEKALDKTINKMKVRQRHDLKATSFAQQKGHLRQPVSGKIISHYGKARKGDYNAFTFQSGIDIKVERGAPVYSVFSGEIMFAQWLKGYGNLVIINHGDNYYTLYAHVEEMFKKKGEWVGTEDVIATAGDTGSIKGLCLHFEIRHHGKPVNPMTWLKKGA